MSRFSARSAVLRHYILAVLEREGRPLRLGELRELIDPKSLSSSELGQALLQFARQGEVERIPVTYPMWLELQAQGVRSRPCWLYSRAGSA